MKIYIVLFFSPSNTKLAGFIYEGEKILTAPSIPITATITKLKLELPSKVKALDVGIGFVRFKDNSYPVPVRIEDTSIAEIEEEADIKLDIEKGKDSVMTISIPKAGEIEIEDNIISIAYKS
jgi:hypothetical protein